MALPNYRALENLAVTIVGIASYSVRRKNPVRIEDLKKTTGLDNDVLFLNLRSLEKDGQVEKRGEVYSVIDPKKLEARYEEIRPKLRPDFVGFVLEGEEPRFLSPDVVDSVLDGNDPRFVV